MRASTPARIVVAPRALAAVRRGHPWIFREQIQGAERGLAKLAPGTDVAVETEQGETVGRALVEPASPIAARVWRLGPRGRIDGPLFTERFAQAIAARAATIDPSTTAMRLVHGEGDRMPGVVVDRYADVAVVRFDGEAIATRTDALLAALRPQLDALGVRAIGIRDTTRGNEGPKLRAAFDAELPERVEVAEHGVPFVVDLARGQKTGAFLDQRENRRRVGELARGRRVLNLFSYAGGFSQRAALGGARSVTSVDVAAGAHATAQASFRLAGVDPSKHSFVTGDVWSFLDRAAARGDRWDLIISDPPNMAPSAAAKPKAMASYRKLHAACVAVLDEGGLFCAASCSSHVAMEDFYATLDDETLGGRPLRVLEVAGAGADHPTLPAFPEGRYLKFVVLG